MGHDFICEIYTLRDYLKKSQSVLQSTLCVAPFSRLHNKYFHVQLCSWEESKERAKGKREKNVWAPTLLSEPCRAKISHPVNVSVCLSYAEHLWAHCEGESRAFPASQFLSPRSISGGCKNPARYLLST